MPTAATKVVMKFQKTDGTFTTFTYLSTGTIDEDADKKTMSAAWRDTETPASAKKFTVHLHTKAMDIFEQTHESVNV